MSGAVHEATIADISDVDLLARAVKSARRPGGSKHLRWVAVRHAFALNSTFARQLCRRFDLDLDEEVR